MVCFREMKLQLRFRGVVYLCLLGVLILFGVVHLSQEYWVKPTQIYERNSQQLHDLLFDQMQRFYSPIRRIPILNGFVQPYWNVKAPEPRVNRDPFRFWQMFNNYIEAEKEFVSYIEDIAHWNDVMRGMPLGTGKTFIVTPQPVEMKQFEFFTPLNLAILYATVTVLVGLFLETVNFQDHAKIFNDNLDAKPRSRKRPITPQPVALKDKATPKYSKSTDKSEPKDMPRKPIPTTTQKKQSPITPQPVTLKDKPTPKYSKSTDKSGAKDIPRKPIPTTTQKKQSPVSSKNPDKSKTLGKPLEIIIKSDPLPMLTDIPDEKLASLTEGKEQIKMDGETYVTASINGYPVKVIFDTGCSYSSITLNWAQKLGLEQKMIPGNNMNVSWMNATLNTKTWYLPNTEIVVGTEKVKLTATLRVVEKYPEWRGEEPYVVLGAPQIERFQTTWQFHKDGTSTIYLNPKTTMSEGSKIFVMPGHVKGNDNLLHVSVDTGADISFCTTSFLKKCRGEENVSIPRYFSLFDEMIKIDNIIKIKNDATPVLFIGTDHLHKYACLFDFEYRHMYFDVEGEKLIKVPLLGSDLIKKDT